MQQLIKIIENIEQWAEDRNLINGSTPQKQMLKLMEEFGELCAGVAKNKPEMIKDAIGDCFVVLVILNKQLNLFKYLPLEQYDYYGGSVYSALEYFAQNATKLNVNTNLNSYGDLSIFTKKISNTIKSLESCIGYLEYITILNKLDFKDCVQHAYNQIKDRKGEMQAGIWIKSEDL